MEDISQDPELAPGLVALLSEKLKDTRAALENARTVCTFTTQDSLPRSLTTRFVQENADLRGELSRRELAQGSVEADRRSLTREWEEHRVSVNARHKCNQIATDMLLGLFNTRAARNPSCACGQQPEARGNL